MALIALNDDEILNRVQVVMAEKGITDKKLYEMLGIYEQKWRKWKSRGIPADWHYSFAKILNVNIEWLLTGVGDKHNTTQSQVQDDKKDYYVRVKSEYEAQAVNYLNIMIEFQRSEWLEHGRQLAETAKKIREEVKKEGDL